MFLLLVAAGDLLRQIKQCQVLDQVLDLAGRMLVNGAARAEAPDAMQDDVAATLDAAFALIDACLPSPRSLSGNERFSALPTANFGSERPRAPWSSEGKGSHEVLSIAQGERAADATRATGRGRKQMAHRSRQKEEIARLRGEAALLEAQLDAMRALSSLESSRIPRARESPGLEVLVELKRVEFPIGAVSLLKGIAARQKKLRAASEAENARLRSVMSAQRSAIRSIKRLLIRETERQVGLQLSIADLLLVSLLHYCQISPQQQFNPGHQLVGMDNMVMEHLYEELDEIYGGVDPIFQRYGMPNASMVPTQQRVTRLSATKYVALVMESRIMPFSYQQTASAMWELTLDNCNRCVPNSDLKVSKA